MTKTKAITKEQVHSVWAKILGDKELIQNADEYEAEQISSALLGLYNSYKRGKKPRMGQPISIPAPFKKILVKPWSLEPDKLFDNDDEFRSKRYAKYLKGLEGLLK